MILIYIIASTIIISLFSLVGVFLLSIKESILHKMLLSLVAFSTGSLLGGAFLHLLPEAFNVIDPTLVMEITLVAFICFFLIEKIVHWRHCHDDDCDVHAFGYLNLIGDAVHNFIDGMIIASTFVVSIPLGITTSFALAFHEIPQEIGDFGVLLHAGFTRKRALFLNFVVALTSVLGGIVGYFLASNLASIIPYSLPVAAGGFIYIATSDLMPELIKEVTPRKSVSSFLLFLLGILTIYLFVLFE
ncbi:ZIP family metal transporter [candidate division WWE3 bacterium CG_4_9_14_0_2_um_filter_35_11]|uniref:ZIP family metal transporter n=1 Tax=candidate division WWE3 bacterium CG_4_9_14_0_2_um_filter_35_11 TaxID=1975077 RepID=A0A2M8ELH2_UNCKA|nr:MAG: ZIP family metal transporter [candidate division WWE3 bacterium CG10_big_fil_rev_8_21_14_0_10_35_32]PJC23593.1 MAG: ZIP family metal transporter [candidate division WWE3 bacterium CG_4_9_14_0_2_um_filter_35_11]